MPLVTIWENLGSHSCSMGQLFSALWLKHRCNAVSSRSFQANLTWDCPWSSWNAILYYVQYLLEVKLEYYDKQLIWNTYVIKYKILEHLITRSLIMSVLIIIITWYFTSCLKMLYNGNSFTHKHFWYRQPVFGPLNLSFSTAFYLKSEVPRFICCCDSQQTFWHPYDLGMILQSLCAGGIWTTCGKDFEKETVISCIYHKFQMVYSGITVQNQTVHWWNGNNLSGKSHLNCLIFLSAANSLMFIMSPLRLVIFFLQPGFLGHDFLVAVKMSMHCPFSPSQQHMGLVMLMESGDFFAKIFWSGI